MESFLQDVRFAFRLLVKSPAFTAVAILTLALGIGANTLIFSVINSLLLHPLPFRDPARLVHVTFDDPALGLQGLAFSVPELEDMKSTPDVFEDVCAVYGGSANLTGAKQPERLEMLVPCTNYFSMLGAVPQKGRLFGPQDYVLGFAEGVVISDGLWRRAYAADPNIIGRSVRLDNDPYTIIGVLPPGFRHPGRRGVTEVEVWLTSGFSADPWPKPVRRARILTAAIARLKSGVSLQEAQAKLDVMSAQQIKNFASDYPPGSTRKVQISPLQESLVGNVRPALLLLMGAVVLVVLIASVNLANLLLARASGRQREISLRLALGASRPRMIRQMLTESVLLSLVAGVVGVLTAEACLHFLLHFVPFNLPRESEISIDWVVLGFAVLISFVTGLVFGLAPAIQSTKADLIGALREGARGSGYSTRTHRLRGLLIVSELAFTVVLMIGSGLLMRTFWRLLQEDRGFNSANVVVSSTRFPVPNDPKLDPYFDILHTTPFIRELLRRGNTIPGVELAAVTSDLPATPVADIRGTRLTIEDLPPDSSEKLAAKVIQVSPDYFRVIQTSLVRGRFFNESDEADKLVVAIIDETTAQRYWPGRDAIGRRLKFGQECAQVSNAEQLAGCVSNQPWVTVVGIVRNIKYADLDIGVPHIYTSIYQRRSRILSLVLRTSLAPALLEPQIRSAVQAVDPNLPVFGVRSLNVVTESSMAAQRFSAALVGSFAAMALLLASVGIYGLLAYLVGQRSQEIGVRIALGAQRSHILRMILTQGGVLAGVGVCVGLILAAVAAPMIAALLYGIRAIDPLVFLAVPLVLLGVSFAASYIPARRAAKVSPIVALREG